MTRDEAIARIKEGLSFRSGHDERIKQRLEEARINLEMGKTLPWFLREEDATLTLVAGGYSIDLPDGFIRPDYDEPLRYTPVDAVSAKNIPWRTLADADLSYGGYDAGGPRVAVLRKSTIRIFPAADVDYTLTWSYFKHSDALDGANTSINGWLVNCPDAIIGEAGWRMAVDLKDQAAMQKFEVIRATGKAAYLNEDVARDDVEGPLIMGANN